jgi:hypothetical protein
MSQFDDASRNDARERRTNAVKTLSMYRPPRTIAAGAAASGALSRREPSIRMMITNRRAGHCQIARAYPNGPGQGPVASSIRSSIADWNRCAQPPHSVHTVCAARSGCAYNHIYCVHQIYNAPEVHLFKSFNKNQENE